MATAIAIKTSGKAGLRFGGRRTSFAARSALSLSSDTDRERALILGGGYSADFGIFQKLWVGCNRGSDRLDSALLEHSHASLEILGSAHVHDSANGFPIVVRDLG